MKRMMQDKRCIFILASIAINVLTIYVFLFANLKGFGDREMQYVYFITAISLVVLGELDVLRNYERVLARFQLAAVRWLIALAFLCAVLDYYWTATYAFFANVLMWWVMLYMVVKVMYSGYYAPIKRWVAAAPVILCVFSDFLVMHVSRDAGVIISEMLIILPLALLININFRYRKHLRKEGKKKMATAYMLFGVIMILTEGVFLALTVLKKTEYIGMAYDSIFAMLLVLYTFLISFNIAMKEGRIMRNYRYAAMMAVALVGAAALLGTMLHSVRGVALGMLFSMTLILVQELAGMLFKSGTALEKHKTVIAKHSYDIAQKKKMASFLHDEILQDLYAIRLLLDSPGCEEDVKEAINELTRRVRSEMEEYSVRLEKSISYRENLVNLFEMIEKRYPVKKVNVVLACDQQLQLFHPFDEMIYVIIRELVTNVYKHSTGDFCQVTLLRVQNSLRLEVEDNGFTGKGNLSDEYNSGHGIRKIRDMLEFYDSEIKFENVENGGAKASIVIADITKGM